MEDKLIKLILIALSGRLNPIMNSPVQFDFSRTKVYTCIWKLSTHTKATQTKAIIWFSLSACKHWFSNWKHSQKLYRIHFFSLCSLYVTGELLPTEPKRKHNTLTHYLNSPSTHLSLRGLKYLQRWHSWTFPHSTTDYYSWCEAEFCQLFEFSPR